MIQQRPPLPGAAFVVQNRGSASSSRRSISGPFIPRSYPKQTMQPKPGHAAQAHGQDGVPFELPQRKKSRGKTADADPVQMGESLCIAAKRHHRQDGKPCAKDQCHDDRPQAGQNALQQGNVLVPAVDVGQERYKEQRRGDAAQRCDDGSGHLRDPQSHKGRRVDRNGAGGHLRDRDKVGELLHGQPAVLLHHLTLDQWNGGGAPPPPQKKPIPATSAAITALMPASLAASTMVRIKAISSS